MSFPKTAKYKGKAGRDHEIEEASKVFIVGQEYRIENVYQGQSSTTLVFVGIKGGWNSVLFDFHDHVDLHYLPSIEE